MAVMGMTDGTPQSVDAETTATLLPVARRLHRGVRSGTVADIHSVKAEERRC